MVPAKVTATQAIVSFLTARKASHKGPDLIDLYLKYGCNMETQVNVAAGKGEPVAGKRSTYTDGIDQWFSFRCPKKADSDPEFRDFEMRYPLDLHADGIGCTGWDWVARRSRWVGFDFDSLTDHAVGLTKAEMDRVKAAARGLPYATVRLSTSGGGVHLYVLFEDDPAFDTDNHTEHAALARCVLEVMSRDAGFDFQSTIDGCGGNMWIWHRKSAGTDGLKLEKTGELFKADQLMDDWRNHLPVVERKRPKVLVNDMGEEEEDIFNQLASAHRQVKRDGKHLAIIEYIQKLGIACHWVTDHHLLQTHTTGFQKVFEQKTLRYTTAAGNEEEFEIQGVYDTKSRGTELGEANCFAFPTDNGGWKIYRFGSGGKITEAAAWEQDNQGRTTCWFNVKPSLEMAARALGGRKMKKGGYEFDNAEKAAEVVKLLKPNFEMTLPDHIKDRKTIIDRSKDGQIAMEIPKEKHDDAVMKDQDVGNWNNSDKKGMWTQVFEIAAQPEKLEVSDYDALIRCLETPDSHSAGWAVKKLDGEWGRRMAGSVKTVLQDLGHAKPEAEQIMGRYERNSWKLVSEPFQPEYPRGRHWNLNAPQYKYPPAPRSESISDDAETSRHPHWDLVLNHIGSDLTKYLKDLDWAITYGIRTGGDYLRSIFAVILREPKEKTPYLFLFGPENSGKSIIHEAFSLLVTGGVVMADRALTSQSDFNGELEGAILCVVEEKNISKTPGALAKIKAAVTSPRLSIRKMRQNSYMADNLTHWIQCSNEENACLIQEGDTRITMIFVPALPEGTEVPKTVLFKRLEEEAPHFMRTLLDLTLPPATGRLRVPIVETQFKEASAQRNKSFLESFIAEEISSAPGELIAYSEFFEKFVAWLPNEEKGNWSRGRVSKELPATFQSGTGNANRTYIINAVWGKTPGNPDAAPYYILNNRIKREGNECKSSD